MWLLLSEYFGRYPSQGKVARLLLSLGLNVKNGRVHCGDIEIADIALARAAGVDRRIVRSTIETIEAEKALHDVFAALHSTAMLRDVAPVLGWSCIRSCHRRPRPYWRSWEYRRGRHQRPPGMVDDPLLMEEPRLFIITESTVPPEILPRIKACRGVKSIVLH